MMDDEPMGRTERSHHAVAKDASLLLVQDALVQIRAMAYLRREVAAGKDDPPLDYHERIRLIADACENLPGYLRADTPVEGLKHAWTQASEMQQAWIRETLAQHGIAITDLIGQLDRSCNNLPGEQREMPEIPPQFLVHSSDPYGCHGQGRAPRIRQ
jgi:hypothetical protein